MNAYYNENDPFAAAWLRELIGKGLIADGKVDERDIRDVSPNELDGYVQCHFFAGIGVWSYALRLAGWPDSQPVWTGSCPCPSFSAAGKGKGFDDPRHLWPDWARLIRECHPRTIFGEQVAAAVGHGWLDLVCGDLEAEGYAVAPAVLGAHSVGAPHIRQRLYFVAHSDAVRSGRTQRRSIAGDRPIAGNGSTGLSADAVCNRGFDRRGTGKERAAGDGWNTETERSAIQRKTEGLCDAGERGDTGSKGLPERISDRGIQCETMGAQERKAAECGGYTRGFWAGCDWWYGKDEKYRPIEPGLQPLAHGAAKRVGRLRGYGNAIVAPQAAEFIKAAMECI